MLERGERNQYPPIGKGGHPPLQAFLGPGCGCANTRTHFAQFLLRLFGGGTDVLGDAFRSRFFLESRFYFIDSPTDTPRFCQPHRRSGLPRRRRQSLPRIHDGRRQPLNTGVPSRGAAVLRPSLPKTVTFYWYLSFAGGNNK